MGTNAYIWNGAAYELFGGDEYLSLIHIYAVVCVGAVAVKVKLGFVAVTSAVVNSRHNLVTEVCFPKFL